MLPALYQVRFSRLHGMRFGLHFLLFIWSTRRGSPLRRAVAQPYLTVVGRRWQREAPHCTIPSLPLCWPWVPSKPWRFPWLRLEIPPESGNCIRILTICNLNCYVNVVYRMVLRPRPCGLPMLGLQALFFNSFSNDMLQILGLQTLLVFFIVNCYDRMVFLSIDFKSPPLFHVG